MCTSRPSSAAVSSAHSSSAATAADSSCPASTLCGCGCGCTCVHACPAWASTCPWGRELVCVAAAVASALAVMVAVCAMRACALLIEAEPVWDVEVPCCLGAKACISECCFGCASVQTFVAMYSNGSRPSMQSGVGGLEPFSSGCPESAMHFRLRPATCRFDLPYMPVCVCRLLSELWYMSLYKCCPRHVPHECNDFFSK